MSADALRTLLASGDVDALRLLLKQGDAAPAPTPARAPAAPNLFSDRPLLRLSIEHVTMHLRSVRTMGKLVWPAGHAVALLIARRTARSSPPLPLALIEIGAGAAVPSLVAAATGAFSQGVVATDFTEPNVELVRHHAELNGLALRAERLDVGEGGALVELVERSLGVAASEGALLLLACDMSYDAVAVSHLFASAGALLARGGPHVLLLFARSHNFAHLDAHQASVAEAAGFALVGSPEVHATGVLDAIAEAHLTPCAEDRVSLFLWAARGAAVPGAGTPLHSLAAQPLVEWLLRADGEDAAQEVEAQAATPRATPADFWAPSAGVNLG